MTKGKYQKFNMRLIHQKRSIYNKSETEWKTKYKSNELV